MASSLLSQQVPSQEAPGQGLWAGQEGLLPQGWHRQWPPAPLLRPTEGQAPAMLTLLISQWVEMRQGLESHLLHPELVSFHPDLLDTCGPSGWSLSNQGTSMAGSGLSSEQKIPLEVMERSGVWSEPASPDGSGRGALRSAWDE